MKELLVLCADGFPLHASHQKKDKRDVFLTMEFQQLKK